jgi:hypothetical protein
MKKTLLIAGLAGTISLLAVFSASAWQGERIQQSQELRESVSQTMENNDFQAWLELKNGNTPCLEGKEDLINQDNFHLFAEAHLLAKEGKLAEAKEIFTSLGLEMPEQRMKRTGLHMADGERQMLGRKNNRNFNNQR